LKGPPLPHAGALILANADTGELRTVARGPIGTMCVSPASATAAASIAALTESGMSSPITLTCTRTTPSGVVVAEVEYSEQERAVARKIATAEPSFRRLKGAEKGVGRRIETLW
jgi:hypothetical protein